MHKEELRKLAGSAQKGSWVAYDAAVRIDDAEGKPLVCWGIHCDVKTAKRNHAYIAAANPKQVIELLDEIKAKDAYIAELQAALPDERFLGEIMVNDQGLLQSQNVIDCHQKDLDALPVGTKIYAHLKGK